MTAIPVDTLRSASPEAFSRMDRFRDGSNWPAETVAAEMISRDGREARITFDGADHPARVAFGCLIQPEPGDSVLTGLADGTIWIVSVLERRSDAPPRLWTEGDLGIVSARGSIALTAGIAVDIGGGARARIAAPEIDLHAGVARFVLDELLQVGRRVSWYVTKLRSMGEIVETFAEHVLTRAKRGSRFIEESDQMRAGAIDHRAEGTLQLQAEAAFISADTVVRVDADQIHMG
jgi:Protein of unknown function (DUF3540)